MISCVLILQRILVEPQFSGVFLNMLLGQLNQLDDLWHVDRALYQSMMAMKRLGAKLNSNPSESTIDEIAEIGLTFDVEKVIFDERVSEELIPGGSNIPVTRHNINSYIHRFANFKLNKETSRQSLAFLAGFRTVIPADCIRMFAPSELQLLISGDQKPLNISDLRRNVNYAGYEDNQPYIQVNNN